MRTYMMGEQDIPEIQGFDTNCYFRVYIYSTCICLLLVYLPAWPPNKKITKALVNNSAAGPTNKNFLRRSHLSLSRIKHKNDKGIG